MDERVTGKIRACSYSRQSAEDRRRQKAKKERQTGCGISGAEGEIRSEGIMADSTPGRKSSQCAGAVACTTCIGVYADPAGKRGARTG